MKYETKMLQNIHIKRFNVAQSNNARTRNNWEKYSKGIFNNGWDIANSTDIKFVQVNNDNQTFNRTEEDGTSNAKQRFAVYAQP